MNQMQKQFKFYLYRSFCCFDTVQPFDYNGTRYTGAATVCLCVADKCNGVVQNYITRLPPTTTGTGTMPPKLPPTTISPTPATTKLQQTAATPMNGKNAGSSTKLMATLFLMAASVHAVV